MTCQACGQELPAEAAFCFSCGAPVVAPGCASCGAELVPGAAFCFKCGTRVPEGSATAASGDRVRTVAAPSVTSPVSERRLTSVLFADLVSYTTISESRDTEDVRELLSQYFDVCSTVVRRHGGVVEKFIGDAVMAVWGVPTAHEDDAERAVRAALELVAAVAELGERLELPQLAARAGVVTGEVAATLAAADQGMVAGDPVNTASRVQAAAGSGEVWVDDATRNLTSAAVTYADMGLHQLKGKAEPVQLYRVGTVVATIGGQQRVDGLEAPLMGRDRELRLIKDLFHATEESGRPRLVVVDGEAGVGKSRLGWEFFKYIDGLSRLTLWHRGRCPSYGERVVFWALNEAVRGRLGLLEEDAGAVVIDALDRFLADRVTEEDERSWLRPRMASLLGEEPREFSREDLFGAWTRFFDRVGGGNPVVLLIEDAQYADDGLLAFIEHLVANSSIGCFVLLLARPELMETHPQLGGRRATVVRVEPLPEPAMRGLVEGLVDDLPDEVRQALVTRAEGIPLYAVETVRALIDQDLVTPQGGRYAVTPGVRIDLSTIGAPESLHALVAARLDALAVEERRVLTSASVLGLTFTREGIALLAGDVGNLDDVLARLQRKELLSSEVDRFSAERGQFRFVQSVVQQVAYSRLSRRERKSRHLLVADHFAADVEHAEELAQVIARHLLDAAEAAGPGDHDVPTLRARARDLLVRAGDRAAGLSAHLDALRCYQSALGCEPPRDITAQILRRSARSHLQLEQGEEAGTAAQRAMQICQESGDVVGAAESAALLADVLGQRFRHDEAVELARAHLELLRGSEDGLPAVCALTVEVARSLCFLGRYAECAVPINEALHIAEQIGDTRSIQRATNALAQMQAAVGSRHLARLLFDDMARQARLNDNWPGLNTALGNTALLVSQTDLTAALELNREADRVMTEHGMPVSETSQMNALRWHWLAGRWGAVQELLDEILGTENASPLVRLGGAAVADLCSWSGRPTPAPATSPQEDRAPALQMTVEFVSGTAALRSGDVPGAVRHLRAAVDAEVALSGYWDDFHVYWPIAFRLALEVGDTDAVAALWAHHEEAGQAGPSSNLCGHTRVFEALLELREGQPDRSRAEQLLRDGIEVLEGCGVVVWRAHAQEDLGGLLLAQGRIEDAEPLLEAARATYADLGASAWLARLAAQTRVG